MTQQQANLNALVRGEKPECNMKPLIYRDCEIKQIYPPGPGTWYEWVRESHYDLDSPWHGVWNSIQDCKDEIDEVYAEEEE